MVENTDSIHAMININNQLLEPGQREKRLFHDLTPAYVSVITLLVPELQGKPSVTLTHSTPFQVA